MTVCKGGCGTELARSRGTRPRVWCDDRACRARWHRANTSTSAPTGAILSTVVDTAPESAGRAVAGLHAWLGGRTGLPESLVAMAEALALQLDLRPGDAQLWARYQKALEALTASLAEREQDHERRYQELMAEFATWPGIEAYRAERERAALEEGDERKARRFSKLVPIGCARGEHGWYTWPAGKTTCPDCGAEKVA
jgi:hypothetical protein